MDKFIDTSLHILDYLITTFIGFLMIILYALNAPVIIGYMLLRFCGIEFKWIKDLKKWQLILLLVVCSFYSICVYMTLYKFNFIRPD